MTLSPPEGITSSSILAALYRRTRLRKSRRASEKRRPGSPLSPKPCPRADHALPFTVFPSGSERPSTGRPVSFASCCQESRRRGVPEACGPTEARGTGLLRRPWRPRHHSRPCAGPASAASLNRASPHSGASTTANSSLPVLRLRAQVTPRTALAPLTAPALSSTSSLQRPQAPHDLSRAPLACLTSSTLQAGKGHTNGTDPGVAATVALNIGICQHQGHARGPSPGTPALTST